MSNVSNLSKKYLAWIDYSKGISILIIVFYHFFQNYRDGSNLVNFLYKSGNSITFLAVDIFFVIAGFNTSLSILKQVNQVPDKSNKVNWLNWLKKRVFRLYPTYWLAIIITLLLYVASGKAIEVKSLGDLFLIAIGWPDYARVKTLNPGFWFFSAILQGYLITPLIFIIAQYRPWRILSIGIGLGLLTKIICWISLSNNYIYTLSLIQTNWILSYILPLCLGFYWGFIYYKYEKFRVEDWVTSAIIFGVGLFIYMIFIISQIDTMYMLGFDLVFTPLMMLVCYWFSQTVIDKIPKLNTGIAVMGKNSYQIYLLHQPLFFILLPLLIQSLKIPLYPRLLVSIIITTCLLTIYVVLFNKIEGLVKTLSDKVFKLRKSYDRA